MRIDEDGQGARHLDHSPVSRSVQIAWVGAQDGTPDPVFDAVRASLAHHDIVTDRVPESGRPDVVVVRCTNPMVGLARSREVAPGCPVVVVTASADPGQLVAAVDAGAIGCLVDDHYEADDLELAIARCLDQRPTWSGPTVSAFIESLLPTRGRPPVTRCEALSARQREIMELVSRGLGNRHVATRLFLSEKTIRNHMHNIYRVMGVKGRAAAIACWNRSLHAVDLGISA